MKHRILTVVLIASIVNLAAATARGAGTPWSRLSPNGAGFSVEVPGEPQPAGRPNEYRYASGPWIMAVGIQAVDPRTKQLVERGDRKAIVKCLESVRDAFLDGVSANRRGSSSGDLDGYPSLRFSLENAELEGTNLFVLTTENLYMVITIGPKGTSNDDAKRFLKSFRLVETDSRVPADVASSSVPATGPAAAKLAPSVMTAARLVIEERMNPRIDDIIQNAPPAAKLGDRWNPSNASWQQARRSISGRIERILGWYQDSGELARKLETTLKAIGPDSEATIAAALNGPAGSAILHELGRMQFASMIMSDDPDGPRVGERAWLEKQRELLTMYDRRTGVTARDRTYDADVANFFSGPSIDASRVCLSTVAAVTRDIEYAINLMMFDESEAIRHEIESAIGRTPGAVAEGMTAPERAVREFIKALAMHDASAFATAVRPDPRAGRFLNPQPLTQEQQAEASRRLETLQVRASEEIMLRGKPVQADANGDYPVGTVGRFLASGDGGPAVVTVVREKDGWRVDLRWWLAMLDMASAGEPAEGSPEHAIKNLILALLALKREAASRFLAPGGDVGVLFAGAPPYREPSGVLEATTMEMPLVEIGPGEFYAMPSGRIVEGSAAADRKVIVGQFGSVAMPFVLRRVGAAWRVEAEPYFALINR